jgi:hypothetical protein
MVSGFLDTIRKFPNPAEAQALIHEINTLIGFVEKIPTEKFKAITTLLDDVIQLQKQNPGSVEPLKMAVEMVREINNCDIEKLAEMQKVIKEAAKLPIGELLKTG